MHVASAAAFAAVLCVIEQKGGKQLCLWTRNSIRARHARPSRELVAAQTPLWSPRAACLARQLRTVLLHRLPACDGRAGFSNP